MDLTCASVFWTGGIIGQLAGEVRIASMIISQMAGLRPSVIASVLVGVRYSIVWWSDPVSSF